MLDLEEFIKEYEKQTNTHIFDNVKDLISPGAVYWFSDGTFVGIDEIRKAFESTWQKIQDEVYKISDVRWLAKDNIAACIYQFEWKGLVEGIEKSGQGRGTNVMILVDGNWQVIHEHLSKLD